MDLKINEYKLPEAIQFNFEELKAELMEKTETYKHMVYTDSDIKTAKADRAELNRLKKALNDERLTRQKAYMKPFDAFKKQVDEIIAIIDEPVKIIDDQVKAFEAKVKSEKKQEIIKRFDLLNPFSWLRFEQIFDEKWLNAAVSIGTVENEMNVIFAGIETNLNSLKGFEYEFEVTEFYKESLSLPMAVLENKRLIELNAKRAEAKPEVKSDEPREWMTLKLKINTNEYDALEKWLNAQGIEWSMT